MAGCDPLAGLLVHEMGTRHGIRVVPLLRSSAEALDLLRRGLAHVAGLHLTDASGRSTNHLSVKSVLGSGYRLLHQVQWESGIAVVGTRKERSADALLRANVRWVNREEGSAARRAFDLLLASRRKPSGYSHIVRDHRAVAATISSGWAEAGICVKPAAAEAQLRFIPLLKEVYELCVPDALLDDPRVSALVMTLQTTWYRRLLAGIPGCVSRDTGSVRLVA
jgi:molybdate-binding protein